jgi:hypothetical protein
VTAFSAACTAGAVRNAAVAANVTKRQAILAPLLLGAGHDARSRLYQALVSERHPEDRHVAADFHVRFLLFGGAVLDRNDAALDIVDPTVRDDRLGRQVPLFVSRGDAAQLLVDDPQLEPLVQPAQRVAHDRAVLVELHSDGADIDAEIHFREASLRQTKDRDVVREREALRLSAGDLHDDRRPSDLDDLATDVIGFVLRADGRADCKDDDHGDRRAAIECLHHARPPLSYPRPEAERRSSAALRTPSRNGRAAIRRAASASRHRIAMPLRMSRRSHRRTS